MLLVHGSVLPIIVLVLRGQAIVCSLRLLVLKLLLHVVSLVIPHLHVYLILDGKVVRGRALGPSVIIIRLRCSDLSAPGLLLHLLLLAVLVRLLVLASHHVVGVPISPMRLLV